MSDDVNYKDLMIAKALTKEELDQEAVWAEQFEHWWDAEGQYHRAGGNDYCKTFAWWAWLNREKSKQAEIDGLKAQLDNMEQCYIQVKKQLEDAIYLKDEHRKRRCQLARELTRKSLQELEINQISQSNQEWQRINSELQKRVDDCAALAKEWRTLAREMCPLDDKYVIGARLGCAQDIEEVLRGEHE